MVDYKKRAEDLISKVVDASKLGKAYEVFEDFLVGVGTNRPPSKETFKEMREFLDRKGGVL
ncbi:MAG: hypothetical protein Kow0069_25270 [Promethearchaeota archaeon]